MVRRLGPWKGHTFPVAWLRGVWPGNLARLVSVSVSSVLPWPPFICLCPADFRKDMQVWREEGGHVFQNYVTREQTLSVFLSIMWLPRAVGRGLERKFLHPFTGSSFWEGRVSTHSLWLSSDLAAVFQAITQPLSLVRYLLITTRWHCRLKWNTANLPAPRWGSGIPHLGVMKTFTPICSFYRWPHWGS